MTSGIHGAHNGTQMDSVRRNRADVRGATARLGRTYVDTNQIIPLRFPAQVRAARTRCLPTAVPREAAVCPGHSQSRPRLSRSTSARPGRHPEHKAERSA